MAAATPLLAFACFASLLTLAASTAFDFLRPAPQPQPSQFEVAMIQTLKGVKSGTLPDPKLRKADGTPGSLLQALLPPEESSEEQKSSKRRILASASRFMGAKLSFSQGPPLSAYNQSFFRYTSVAYPNYVDWRSTAYVTPILVQYNCANCWVVAAADTVAMATAIAAGTAAVAPGIQSVCDCSGMACCNGGWPEDAFSWLTSQGNITTSAAYQYWAQDNRTCTLASNYPVAGKITGWERVPDYSQTALIKAVSMQPVLVYISASSSDFIGYTSTPPGTKNFSVYDGNCSTEVNHAVVVVGFNTQASIPYWIIKNSWPNWGWGDNGYMYLRMIGDGAGKCGIQSVAPLYPINFPNQPTQLTVSHSGSNKVEMNDDDYWWNWWSGGSTNPCYGVINPCGSGSCYNAGGIARCYCPSGYVEIVGAPTSKCVDASPCSSPMFSPCGAGACMDYGDGSYICQCPSGYALGSLVSGAPTCVPVVSSSKPNTYTVQYGDSCASIASTYGISSTTFLALNPYVSCQSRYLPPGTVVTLGTTSTNCMAQYAVRPGDTCSLIAYYLDNKNLLAWMYPSYWGTSSPSLLNTVYSLAKNAPYSAWSYPISKLQALNPTLSCRNLYQAQPICLAAPTSLNSTVTCGSTYTTVKGDSCSSVQNNFRLNSTTFLSLNPGLDCTKQSGYFSPGLQLCILAATVTSSNSKSSSTSSTSTSSSFATSTTSTSSSSSLNSTTSSLSSGSGVSVANCSNFYSVQQGDSCAQIWSAANLSQYQFTYINPGLQCQAPFLYVGQQVCINSSLLANIQDPSYLTYTVQPGDRIATVQAQFAPKCMAYSISFQRIAAQNDISDWTSWTLVSGTTLVIPCVPKVGAQCGCIPSLTVCGGDFVNYPSYCDATCNFASPITTGSCSACQSACAGRYGTAPSPTSACASGYTCPYPTWPPSVTDASKIYTCTYATGGTCLCNYRQQTCTQACANYVNTVGGVASTCYNACYSCARVPCGGPSITQTSGTGFCTGGCPTGNYPCNPYGRTCAVNCNYWNNWWLSNSVTNPAFNP